MLSKIVIFSLLLFRLSVADISADVRSLLEFKKGIEHDPSGLVTASWAVVGPESGGGCPTTWHGVKCDDSGASIVAVSLAGLGLSGELKFSTLVPMSSLQTLALAGNRLTGRLVPALGSIQSLQTLDLSSNGFYGPIPGRIADLYNLVHLNLSHNNFEGGFPVEIRNLQQLRVLDLRSNKLWGDVKVLLSQLRNVEHVDLSQNRFFGEFYMDSSNFTSMANTAKYLNFSGNQIFGGFGRSVRLFRNLEVLDLGQNKLNGELPEFDSMPNLKVLRAGSNFLSGPIPEGLFESGMQLVEIDLSGNGFTGNFKFLCYFSKIC